MQNRMWTVIRMIDCRSRNFPRAPNTIFCLLIPPSVSAAIIWEVTWTQYTNQGVSEHKAYIIHNFPGRAHSPRLTYSLPPHPIQMPSDFFQEPKPTMDFKSYTENEDFLVEGKAEPSSRSQVLIFGLENLSWWVKVTFRGEILRMTDEPAVKGKTTK